MNKFCFSISIFFFFCSFTMLGQVSDLARVEYTYFPQRGSDNSFKRFRALLNYPIKLDDKGSYLVTGLEYREVNFDYEDLTSFDVSGFDRLRSAEFTIGYTFKLKNDWRFAIKSGAMVASNFENNKITSDDLLYSGAIFFIKDKKNEGLKKPWRLILGLQYSTTAGRPFPLPIVNYFKEFHPSWSYSLGVPKSNIKYAIDEKNKLQVFATLDGFYANLQNDRLVTNGSIGSRNQVAENISMTIALGGLGYEHLFTKHLVFYSYFGYTLLNDIRLRNDDQENVLTINDQNSFYIRGGLKLKL
ncbi:MULTISPECIES: DUF6268 family outer membrane beta-barrel protein [Aquimarina]|uniref:DUF6268 family outer membrane beta-barrel protein n=1 Tax=Aquimarina TaxID=290174 RepID=UPI0004826CCF|nr:MULTISPECIES: DUF6268 family outer membrane beta-barrel protein [Aquimarina]